MVHTRQRYTMNTTVKYRGVAMYFAEKAGTERPQRPGSQSRDRTNRERETGCRWAETSFFFFGSLMLHMYVHEFLFRFPTRRREEKCISREEKGKRFVDCLAVRPYDVCLVSRRARISGAECLRSRETETGRSAPEGEKEAQKTLLGGPNT